MCILCACTKSWSAEEPIEPSDAVKRMRECFEDKLGYLVIQVGTIITSKHLDEVLQELSEVQLPCSYHRLFFYYFGHGTEKFLCLADQNFERSHIIGQLQSMYPTHSGEFFKIFLFDSCRTGNFSTTYPIQAQDKGTSGALSGGEGPTWKKKMKESFTANTLVISAADFNSKAYYIDHSDEQVNGCGLVTLFFTKLAPELNVSLCDLLRCVRVEVDKYIRNHPKYVQPENSLHYYPQVLVYEDRLMGSVNLLAESTGSGK